MFCVQLNGNCVVVAGNGQTKPSSLQEFELKCTLRENCGDGARRTEQRAVTILDMENSTDISIQIRCKYHFDITLKLSILILKCQSSN